MTVRYVVLDEIPGQARARLRLSGPDTRRFLQGILTTNVESHGSDQALAAGLCTAKGKLVTELLVLPAASAQEVHLLVPAEQEPVVALHFERHIIMDDVEVERMGSVEHALVWRRDDESPAAVEGIESWPTRHPAPGRLCLGTDARLVDALSEFERVDPSEWAGYRIDTASPAWGHELREGLFPPEMGFVYAVSYDKGCFLGQEPLARIHARGQVNRVMVRVRAHAAPDEVAVLASEERDDAGRWTTWALRTKGGSDGGPPIDGLAIVRREVAVAGTRLRTVTAGDSIAVEVQTGPLGDDPGIAGAR